MTAKHLRDNMWSILADDGQETIFCAPGAASDEADVLAAFQIANEQIGSGNVPREALLASYKAAFDGHLDAVAQERQYDNRLTIVSYLGSTNPQWNAEAETYIAWRDAALAYMFGQLTSVEAGEIAPPSIEEFIAGIAPIDWPAVSP
jgi:hypothetical protein